MTEVVENSTRLTIYLGESDQWQGRPLWQALLGKLRKEGVAGATVVRGVAGFGAHSRIHTASLVRLSADLPLMLIVVDTAEKIDAVLPTISPMVKEGLITLEPIEVVKYSHRFAPELPPDRRVRDVMTGDVVTAHPDTPLSEIADRLLRELFTAIPIVDDARHVVGIVSDGDFLRWPELALQFRAPAELSDTTLDALMAELHAGDHTAEEVMTTPVVTIHQDRPVTEAAHLIAQRGLKRLPIVDDEDRLVGMLSRIDVLRTVVREARPPSGAPPAAGDLHELRDVMRPDVPTVAPDAALSEIIAAIVASDLRRVIVVDAERRPVGVITDGDLIARVQPAERSTIVDALMQRIGLREARPVRGDRRARDLMSSPVVTAPEEMRILDAIQRLVDARRRRLVVVDADGRLTGIVDRQMLLRALLGGGIPK